jgi:hypothetical protein
MRTKKLLACEQFPSLNWLAQDLRADLVGIRQVIAEVFSNIKPMGDPPMDDLILLSPLIWLSTST